MASKEVASLVITLRRSFIGTRKKQRAVLEALGLKGKINQTVEQPNNDSVRGSILKVTNMVSVKTRKQFDADVAAQAAKAALREPIRVQH